MAVGDIGWNIPRIMRKRRYLALGVASVYIGALVLGLISCHVSESVPKLAERLSDSSADGVEMVFGRFRESVREGDVKVILLCSLLIFTLNMVASITHFTLPGILLLPGVGFLLFSGWLAGVSFASLHASSLVSYVWYLFMVSLELATGILALTAGLDMGLSLLRPARQQVRSRRQAFGLAFRDACGIYLVITLILAVQAVLEILYVRQILLRGGTGVPLTPY